MGNEAVPFPKNPRGVEAFGPSNTATLGSRVNLPAGVPGAAPSPPLPAHRETRFVPAERGACGCREGSNRSESRAASHHTIVVSTDQRRSRHLPPVRGRTGGAAAEVYFSDLSYPWRCMGRIATFKPSGEPFFGSGTLIGTNLVLTAAHVIQPDGAGGMMPISFQPGAAFGQAAEQSIPATDALMWSGSPFGAATFFKHGVVADQAVLRLSAPIGLKLGYLGVVPFYREFPFYKGGVWSAVGYPLGPNGPQFQNHIMIEEYWSEKWEVQGEEWDAYGLQYNMNFQPGESGGPLFGWFGGGYNTWDVMQSPGGERGRIWPFVCGSDPADAYEDVTYLPHDFSRVPSGAPTPQGRWWPGQVGPKYWAGVIGVHSALWNDQWGPAASGGGNLVKLARDARAKWETVYCGEYLWKSK